MDLNELNKKLRILNFHPIHVEGSASPDEAKGFTFSGNLEEYFEAARALNCSVIFITIDVTCPP